jgi:hypothetical protein
MDLFQTTGKTGERASQALEFLSRPDFYPDGEEIRHESSVGDGPVTSCPDEPAEVDDPHWIESLLSNE